MRKNEEYIAEAIGCGSEGEAVFSVDGCSVFVPYCIEGERARIKILSLKGSAAYGKCEEILSCSPHRVKPVCPVFYKCGGCQLQHMDYGAQKEFKTRLVANTLRKIGGIEAEVLPAEGSGKIFGYRNKLVLPIGVSNGRDVVGFYAERSHRIVPADDCAIQAGWCAAVIACIKEYMLSSGLHGYEEETRKGDLRRIAVREVGGRYIVALVAARVVDAAPLSKLLEGALGKDFTFLLNVNRGTGNAVFGDEWHILRGDGFFEAEDMGVKFRAGANTFLQVNDAVRTELYRKIAEEAADGGAVAIDLYSGGGMLTALLARACKSAYGIELVREASACADELKELNGLSDKMFNICGKVEEELKGVFCRTRGERRVIVCDPPRKGMERSVVRAIAGSGADKVILVSCNPATLARDLGLLTGALEEKDGNLKKNPCYASTSAYRIEYIQPYDMFPQTKHVETLVVLSKN